MRVFLTGGAGYIGSHTLADLLAGGHEACVYDNYANSDPEALERVRSLTNRGFESVEGDIRHVDKLRKALTDFRPDAVIHFAGLKAVGDSVVRPLDYYENNVQGSIALLRAMGEAGCGRIVFSSSATVYGDPTYLPLDEAHPLAPTNPYGRTKQIIEEILRDWTATQPGASAVLLRYFNPVGAHASGRIGEDPLGPPANLLPLVSQVATGRREYVSVFGDDYPTRDGTGERDYVHVVDLARAHTAALAFCAARTGCEAINVGVGRGATVLEVIRTFEAVSGRPIPYRIVGRRAGDTASSVADPAKALALLGWRAERDLRDICQSAWAWQSANPEGYRKSDASEGRD